jgi:uncharacterized protein (TIGR02246 family)
MTDDEKAVRSLIEQWDAAWNRHDAGALTALHHPDAQTVNRFAQMLVGEAEHRKQLQWLHEGPFRGTESPPQKVVALRFVRPDVALVHTRWGTPELEINGASIPAEQMVVSYVATKEDGRWGFAAVDLHNVPAGPGNDTRLPTEGTEGP